VRYLTRNQSDGSSRAQKTAVDFGLTNRALKFARLYAENLIGRSSAILLPIRFPASFCCPRSLMALKYFRWLMIVFVVGGLFSAFRLGLDRGFEHTIGAESYGRIGFATCAAITDVAHHGPGRYICNNTVETVLAYAGLSGDEQALAALGTKYPDNLRDQTLIDNAIKKAVLFPITPAHTQFRGAGPDDIGMVDFVKLAFTLFGYNLISLYLTYFTFLGSSVWAFFRAFGDRPAYLATLAVTVFAHLALLSSAIFDFTPYTFGTVTNPRFLSAIAIIPGLHIAFSMMSNTRIDWYQAIFVAFQASIVVFAISIRAVAIWVPFGLAVLGTALWLSRRCPRSLWPLGMLLGIWVVHAVYIVQVLDPIYARMGGTGSHSVWHSIYYSLQAHPNWKAKYDESHRYATGDNQPWAGAENYLARHPLQKGDVPLYFDDSYPNYAGMEKYVRASFFEFARSDPKFVLETFLIYKPRELLVVTGKYFIDALYLRGIAIWLWYGLMAGLIAFFAGHRAELIELFKTSSLVTGALFASIVPLLITVPMVSDNLFVLLICTGLWIVLLSAVLARCMLQLFPRVSLIFGAPRGNTLPGTSAGALSGSATVEQRDDRGSEIRI
jgi:hypothetical protein